MDIEKSPNLKKPAAKSVAVSIIDPRTKRFSFSKAKNSLSPTSKASIDFLSLFLNPENEKLTQEEPLTGPEKGKSVADTLSQLSVAPKENGKVAEKEEVKLVKEGDRKKRRSEGVENAQSKRRIEENTMLGSGKTVTLSFMETQKDSYKMALFDILNRLLVPPIIEVNIRLEQEGVGEDEKAFVIVLASKEISKKG